MNLLRIISSKVGLCTAVTFMLLSGPTECKDNPERTGTEQSSYPLEISWKTEVTKPVTVTDAPEILYRRIGKLEFDSVSWCVKFESTEEEKPAPVTINSSVPVHVPKKQGTITGETGKVWTELVALYLYYFMPGVSGHAKIRIALFEPRPADQKKEDWTPRQLSNWLTLPIRIANN